MMPPNWPGHFVARLHGRDIAAISSIARGNSRRAMWNTYVCVEDADQFGAAGAQAGKDILDVFDGDHHAT